MPGSPRAMAIITLILGAAVSGARISATQTPPSPHASFAGVWRLNVGASSGSTDYVPTIDVPAPSGPPPTGGGVKPTNPTGPTDSGVGPAAGSAMGLGMNWFGGLVSGSNKPVHLSDEQALFLELMTPPTTLTVAVTPTTVSMEDDTARRFTFATNGKEEKHQLTRGVIKTKTQWSGAILRQDINGGGQLKCMQTFALSEDGRQLIVNMGPPSDSAFGIGLTGHGGSGSTPALQGTKRSIYERNPAIQ